MLKSACRIRLGRVAALIGAALVVQGAAPLALAMAAHEAFVGRGMAVSLPSRPDLPALEFSNLRPSPAFDFNSPPVINAGGDVAFWAKLGLAGGGSFGDSVWTYGSNGVMSPVALAGDPVPGVAGGTYHVGLGRRLILDRAGNLAFNPLVVTPTGVVQAIAAGGATPTRISVIVGQTVPQIDPLSPAFGYQFESLGFGTNFINPYNGEEFVFAGNKVAFEARIGDPTGVGPDFTSAIYTERPFAGTPTGLELVVRNGFDTSFVPQSEALGISPTGEVMFKTNVFPGNGDPFFGGIATYTNDISYIAKSGSEAGGDVSFGGFSGNPGFNAIGQAAFGASFTDLPDSNSGIFKSLAPDGIIATEGIVAAGAPDLSGDGVPDFTFLGFSGNNPLLNAQGNVVFKHFARTPDGSLTFTGLWSDRTGGLTSLDLIAANGDQAPGLPAGTVFTNVAPSGMDSVVINANNDVAFVAVFKRPDNSTGFGIWAERNGVLTLIAAPGDTVNLPDGSSFVITNVNFMGGSGNQDGRPSGFSDSGEITFRADGLGIASAFVVSSLVATLAGDYNGSGQVEQGDLDLVLQNWGDDTAVTGIPSGWVSSLPQGQIEQTELDAILQNWGSTAAPDFSGSSVPEPTVGLLMLSLGVLHRRRRNGQPLAV